MSNYTENMDDFDKNQRFKNYMEYNISKPKLIFY